VQYRDSGVRSRTTDLLNTGVVGCVGMRACVAVFLIVRVASLSLEWIGLSRGRHGGGVVKKMGYVPPGF